MARSGGRCGLGGLRGASVRVRQARAAAQREARLPRWLACCKTLASSCTPRTKVPRRTAVRALRTRFVVSSTQRSRWMAKTEHPFGGCSRVQPLALRRSEVLCSTARATAATKRQKKMRPGSVFGLTTLGLVSRTSMDDRLGEGPPLWEGEQQFHAFLGYALLTAMAAACACHIRASMASLMRRVSPTRHRRATQAPR